MKTKLLLLLFLSAFKLTTFAQNKVVKYCEVEIFGYNSENLKTKITIGKVDSLFSIRNSNLADQFQKVNSLKTVPDVLNYMALIGWSLFGNTASGSRAEDKFFYFKKEFDPSELNSTKTQ